MSVEESQKSNYRLLWISLILILVQRIVLTLSAVHALAGKHLSLWTVLIGVNHQWDSGWFVNIAEHGYTTYQDTAFFPVYPLLIYIVHYFTRVSFDTSGALISFSFFGVAVFYLGLIIRRLFDIRVAIVAISLFTFYPMAFFFDAIYSESVFMALCLASIYYSLNKRFWIAGCIAALASLARNTGALLDIIILFDYLSVHQGNLRFWKKNWWCQFQVDILTLLFPAVAVLGYCVYCKDRVGRFFSFLHAEHQYWHRSFMCPWNSFIHSVVNAKDFPVSWIHWYYMIEIVSFTACVIVMILGVGYAKQSISQLGWWLYGVIILLVSSSEPIAIPVVHDYLVSFPRYTLMIFPMFFYGALFFRRLIYAYIPVLLIFALALIELAQKFYVGVWLA